MTQGLFHLPARIPDYSVEDSPYLAIMIDTLYVAPGKGQFLDQLDEKGSQSCIREKSPGEKRCGRCTHLSFLYSRIFGDQITLSRNRLPMHRRALTLNVYGASMDLF